MNSEDENKITEEDGDNLNIDDLNIKDQTENKVKPIVNFLELPDDIVQKIYQDSLPNDRNSLIRVNQEMNTILRNLTPIISRKQNNDELVKHYSFEENGRYFIIYGDINDKFLSELDKLTGYDIYPLLNDQHMLVTERYCFSDSLQTIVYDNFTSICPFYNLFNNLGVDVICGKIKDFGKFTMIDSADRKEILNIKISKSNIQITADVYKKNSVLMIYEGDQELNVDNVGELYYIKMLKYIILYNDKVLIKIKRAKDFMYSFDSVKYVKKDIKKIIVCNIEEFNKLNPQFIYIDQDNKLYKIFSLTDTENLLLYDDIYLDIDCKNLILDVRNEKIYYCNSGVSNSLIFDSNLVQKTDEIKIRKF